MTDALLTIPALFAVGLLTGNEFATRAGVNPALDDGEWRPSAVRGTGCTRSATF